MNDPYFGTQRCVDRLLREYYQHKKLIVAVDFDDTVFDFHNEGNGYPEIVDVLRRCQEKGFHLVLFTGSHIEKWEGQKQYLLDLGISIEAVNKNPFPLPFGNHGKIYYNILLDDRAGLGQAYRILIQVLNKIDKEEK